MNRKRLRQDVESFLQKDYIKMVQRILIYLLCFLILMDIIWYFTSGHQTSISRVMRDHALEGGFWLTYVWGVLCSHLFFDRKKKARGNEDTVILGVAGIGIYLALIGLVFKIEISNLYFQVLNLGFGFIIGLIFWRQTNNPDSAENC